ncbi:hypothetical protein DDE83_005696 [Stemphylium lycopersici]|uniref:Uncharacterized protein n=1 Tax=Stemphylium lycopersici TaxID=183478 RepID=A0A364N102_STELY|nr:hypothetical protein DDE83_005696 [Stemphylium lycopersici]
MARKSLSQRLASNATTKAPATTPTTSSTVLTKAFVSAPGPKSRDEADANAAENVKIYSLSSADRKLLAKGPKVHIVDYNGNFIIEMSYALFRAISTKKDLVAGTPGVQPGVIALPSGLDTAIVADMIQHFKDHTTSKQYAKDLKGYDMTYPDIQLCSAGDYLGMSIYTQHIFNWYWARLRSGHLPSYADIDAVTSVHTLQGDSIFRKVVQAVVAIDMEGGIPDPEDYQAYLETNGRFRVAVEEAKIRAQGHHGFMERKKRREEVATRQDSGAAEQYKVRAQVEKERNARENARWDEKKKAEAELAARVKAKMVQSGKKQWKHDEAAYMRRVYGKNVPV